jgi:hypothetical protein
VIESENPKVMKREPVIPRVSKAGGGLVPGTDLSNPSTFQEVDDLNTCAGCSPSNDPDRNGSSSIATMRDYRGFKWQDPLAD